MTSRSKRPKAASAAHAPAHDQAESVGESEEAKGEDEDGLKSLKNSPMDGENKLDNEDAHPVSGTSAPQGKLLKSKRKCLLACGQGVALFMGLWA